MLPRNVQLQDLFPYSGRPSAFSDGRKTAADSCSLQTAAVFKGLVSKVSELKNNLPENVYSEHAQPGLQANHMYLTVCVGSAVKQTRNTKQSCTVTEGKLQTSYRLFVGKQLFPDPEEVLAKLSQTLNEAFL